MDNVSNAGSKSIGQIDSVYLHVGNGGATVSISDLGFGPTLDVGTRSFGNCETQIRVHTTVEGLVAIRDLIDRTLNTHKFSPPYVHAAGPERPNTGAAQQTAAVPEGIGAPPAPRKQ